MPTYDVEVAHGIVWSSHASDEPVPCRAPLDHVPLKRYRTGQHRL